MAGRRDPGGILGLLDLIEEHRAALRYDWRTRFQVGLDSVPDVIHWDEALDLVRILRGDPSSELVASIEKWDHPLSREGWILSDLMDLQGGKAMGKKWKAYRRPVKPKDQTTTRRGNAAGRTGAQVIEILAQFGHGPRPVEQNEPPSESLQWLRARRPSVSA